MHSVERPRGPATAAGRDYLLDNSAPTAGRRFDDLATVFDPITFGHLDALGVPPGWRCWEVGAGGPSVVRWLSARVEPSGHVLATDVDVRWLGRSSGTVEVRRHDIVADDPPDGLFDLVHARLVLMHLPRRALALERLVAAVRPGGWLLVEDFDARLQPRACVDVATDGQRLANEIRDAFHALLAERGADLMLGRRLPRLLRRAGLVDVAADAYLPLARPAGSHLEVATIEQVRDDLIASGRVAPAEIDEYLRLAGTGALDITTPLLVSAWGRRPARGSRGAGADTGGVERFVDVGDGYRLWAWATGPVDATAIVLVMGANTSGVAWPDRLVARLAERHRVICYDHRDTGRSTWAFDERPYAIRDLAGDVLAVLDAFGVDRAHAVGMSMGGVIVQLLLVDHRERLRSATVFCTTSLGSGLAAGAGQPDVDLPGPDPRLLEMWAEMGTPRDPDAEMAWRVEHWRLLNGDVLEFDPDEWRQLEQRVIDHSGRMESPSAHARADQAGLERGAELAGVEVPTLVIEAPADPINPPPHAAHLAATIAGARLVTIPGMGHALSPAIVEPLATTIADHVARADADADADTDG